MHVITLQQYNNFEMEMERRLGIIAVPFPIQGHINPMLRFCCSLAAGGAASINVTLVLTHGVAKSLQSLSLPPFIHAFKFISDGSEDGPPSSFEEYQSRLQASVSEGVAAVIGRRKRAAEILVYDSMMPWLAEIGRAGGLRVAALFTQSASVCHIYCCMLQGCSDLASLPDSRGLPEFSYFGDISEQVKMFVVNQASNMCKADWLLFNTFNALEKEAMRWMSEKWAAVKTIGPLVPRKTKRTPFFKQERIELYESDDEGCMAWLDKQQPNSVVYVSFGTVVVWSEEQMLEIATALVESDQPFLWAVRESEESKLPEGFLDPNQKGLVVRWCPQVDVLSHESVACFVTHCGWNSVLEAVCSGVPVVGMPQIVDQPANARLVEDVWRVGVRVRVDDVENGIVSREEIRGCVARVMGGDEFRRNAVKWKGLAEEALAEGGSSHANIKDFLSQLDSHSSSSSSSS